MAFSQGGDMTNEEKIQKIEEWQSAGFVHELTCGISSSHGALVPKDVHGTVTLVCPNNFCEYNQTRIPDYILLANIPKTKMKFML